MALAKPSWPLGSVTKSAAPCTSGLAYPSQCSAATLEHRNVVGAIADGGNLGRQDTEHFREAGQRVALVGMRVSKIEIVGLRAHGRRPLRERGTCVLLQPGQEIEIVADSDNLGGGIEATAEILDDDQRVADPVVCSSAT